MNPPDANYLCRGNYGRTTCYSSNVLDKHVSSFYVDHINAQGYRNVVECGWLRWSTWSYARGLWVYGINIYLNEVHPGVNYWDGVWNNLGAGTNHRYQVAYIGPVGGLQRWYFFIDDSTIAIKDCYLVDGWGHVGCERNRLDESNYGRFQDLQRRYTDGSWALWTHAVAYGSNDPQYAFRKKGGHNYDIECYHL